jgi:hypothetical protein
MNRSRKEKGQIASIIMTIVFLVIAVSITFFAVITLIATKGTQLELAVSVLGGTSHPIAFASGAAALRDRDGRSLIEQGIHAVASRDSAIAGSMAQSVAALTVPFGIESYAITVRSENNELASSAKLLKFCGRASESKFAYCQNSCPIGSSEFPAGQQVCSLGEKCCVENYNATSSSYVGLPAGFSCTTVRVVTTARGSASVPSGTGVCEAACSPGRRTSSSYGCGSGLVCCSPSRLTSPAAAAVDSVSIPIVYRSSAGNASRWGSVEIAISLPNIVTG